MRIAHGPELFYFDSLLTALPKVLFESLDVAFIGGITIEGAVISMKIEQAVSGFWI